MTIQDALDYCLENPERLSAQELVSRFPEYREELASLLGVASSVVSLPVPGVPSARRAAMKTRLMSATAGTAPRAAELAPAVSSRPAYTVAPPRALPWYLRPGWVAALAAVLLVAFVWWASAGSLPDSPFYNVKLASENISLNLKGSDLTKAQAHVVLANSRLYDLRTMEQENKLPEAEAAFDNYYSHLSSAVQIWDGLSGQAHTEMAKLLYASSAAGNVTFNSFSSEVSSLPVTMQSRIKGTRAELNSTSDETAQALVAANIDPAGVLSSIDSNIQPLLTAVPAVTAAGGSPTAAAEATATVFTAAEETATAVGSGEGTIVAAAPTEPPAASPTLPAPGLPEDTPTPSATLTSTATASATATRTATPSTTHTTSPTATRTVSPSPSATLTPTPLPASPTPGSSPFPVSPTTAPHPLPPSTVPPVPPRATNVPVTVTPGPQGNTCNVHISAVSAACQGTNNVRWTATVQNQGQAAISGHWTATLQIMGPSGGFRDVKSVSGSSNFGPGNTALAGTIGYGLPSNTRKVRVQLSVDLSGSSCVVAARRSQNIDPCK